MLFQILSLHLQIEIQILQLMEESNLSPIIERLVAFIGYTGLSNSQFADTAGIPRPSLSQMLHGRNKSLNNQMLAKLNEAFPNLNIMWLLFNQGNMLIEGNIEISERQNTAISAQQALDFSENEMIDAFEDDDLDDLFNDKNRTNGSEMDISGINSPNSPFAPRQTSRTAPLSQADEPTGAKISFDAPTAQGKTVSASSETGSFEHQDAHPFAPLESMQINGDNRRISSIIVVYTNGSVETFKSIKNR